MEPSGDQHPEKTVYDYFRVAVFQFSKFQEFMLINDDKQIAGVRVFTAEILCSFIEQVKYKIK